MAFTDIVSFVFTSALFVGTIVGVVIAFQKISGAIESTKAQLKDKGWNVSESGVSVKTDRRMTQEDYVDATQRGIFNAMQAASFRKGAGGSPSNSPDASPNLGAPQPVRSISRSTSRSSIGSEEKKRRHLFRRTKEA